MYLRLFHFWRAICVEIWKNTENLSFKLLLLPLQHVLGIYPEECGVFSITVKIAWWVFYMTTPVLFFSVSQCRFFSLRQLCSCETNTIWGSHSGENPF